ncbi:hypothetical protein KQI63_06340 [bacterium]|nr:hypothetical protein [bacterium]
MKTILLSLAFFLLISLPGLCDITIVNSNLNAYAAFEHAIDGDTIVFEPGIYELSHGFDNVQITLGSYDLLSNIRDREYNYRSETIIKGTDQNGNPRRVFTFENDQRKYVTLVGLSFSSPREPNLLPGGALYFSNAYVSLLGCRIFDSYGFWGGAAAFDSCSGQIKDCEFIGNTSVYTGGGIQVNSGEWVIETSSFKFNYASPFEGGGLCVHNASGTLENCTFTGNVSLTYGGGVMINGNHDTWLIANNTFHQNMSVMGAGLDLRDLDRAVVDQNLFLENETFSNQQLVPFGAGADIVVVDTLTFSNNILIRNISHLEGGAARLGGRGVIHNNVFLLNSAYN